MPMGRDRRSSASTQPHPSASRSAHGANSLQTGIATVCYDLARLAQAVEIVGTYAKLEGIGVEYGGAIEVLGEVICDRVIRLSNLIERAAGLNVGQAHG